VAGDVDICEYCGREIPPIADWCLCISHEDNGIADPERREYQKRLHAKYAALRAALAVRIECWQSPDGGELTCAPKWNCDEMRARDIIESDARLLYAYDVVTWREAMDEHHRRQGWDPYVPPAMEPIPLLPPLPGPHAVDEPLVFQHRRLDEPEFDATDGAHPAWWRGEEYGVARVIDIIREALDGEKPDKGAASDLDQLVRDVRALVS